MQLSHIFLPLHYYYTSLVHQTHPIIYPYSSWTPHTPSSTTYTYSYCMDSLNPKNKELNKKQNVQ